MSEWHLRRGFMNNLATANSRRSGLRVSCSRPAAWTAGLQGLHVSSCSLCLQTIRQFPANSPFTQNSVQARCGTFQKHLANVSRLIIDELGYVPFTAIGAELLFEVFGRRYEHGATLVTSNLPFDEWTSVLGSERLTGALLDRLTHHVHILEMNGESYRLATSKKRQRHAATSPSTEKGGASPT